MPELPEVETVMRGLAKVINGRKIARVEVFSKKLRLPIPPALKKLAGEQVANILIPFKSGRVMILHLGLTGRVLIDPPHPEKHDHFRLTLADGRQIVYNDARRFGLVDVCAKSALAQHRFFAHLGPEPFSDAFDAGYLCAKLQGRKTALKIALMDQAVVVGVGNIYAAEALYRARLSPLMPAGKLTEKEATRLISETRRVLDQSIKAGGSSLRDYVQTDGELGYYQDSWRVYGRAGAACKRSACGGTITRTTQGGRSTFYCPDCQQG